MLFHVLSQIVGMVIVIGLETRMVVALILRTGYRIAPMCVVVRDMPGAHLVGVAPQIVCLYVWYQDGG